MGHVMEQDGGVGGTMAVHYVSFGLALAVLIAILAIGKHLL